MIIEVTSTGNKYKSTVKVIDSQANHSFFSGTTWVSITINGKKNQGKLRLGHE